MTTGMTQTVTIDRLRAMAAATELLDALKTARRVLLWTYGTTSPYVREAVEVIDAALKKAEGL